MKPWIDTFNQMHMPEPMSGCWLWIGSVTSHGYGKMGRMLRDKKTIMKAAHRFSWEHHHGPIRDGLCVLHKCDNTYCVNPDHLFLGTQADNVTDMHTKGRCGAPKGIRHYAAKLTESDIHAIKISDKKQSELARDFGVAPCTISGVRSGKYWKHIS